MLGIDIVLLRLNETCVVMALLDSRSLVQSDGRTLAEGDPEGISERKTQHHEKVFATIIRSNGNWDNAYRRRGPGLRKQ